MRYGAKGQAATKRLLQSWAVWYNILFNKVYCEVFV